VVVCLVLVTWDITILAPVQAVWNELAVIHRHNEGPMRGGEVDEDGARGDEEQRR